MKFFRISLRQGIWLGFGLVLALATGVVYTALRNFQETETELGRLVEVDQPLLSAATRLQAGLARAMQSYSFYFMDPSPHYLEQGGQALRDVRTALERLVASGGEDPELRATLERIGAQVDQVRASLLEGVRIASSRSETYPALKLAAEEVNPRAREILQLLGNMIASEEEAAASEPDRLDMLHHIEDLRYRFMSLVSEVRSFLATRADTTLEDLKLYRDLIEKDREWLESQSDRFTFEEEESAARLGEVFPEYFAALERMIQVHTSEQWRMDAWLIRNRVAPQLEEIRRSLGGLVTTSMQRLDSGSRTLLEHASTASVTILWLLAGMLVAGVLIAAMSVHSVTRLVDRVREGLQYAADGDFTRRHDEAAAGELGEVGRLLNRFSRRMSELLREVKQAAARLEDTSETMAALSSEASEIVRREQERVEQTASAMNQMVASSQEIAGSAAQVASAAREADDQAGRSRDEAVAVREGMQQLVDQVRQSAAVVARLAEESRNIGAVIDVIRGIAEQTNLLALNAAIEAARAGEQGRGFAVVADEVRSLANRTRESTGEIQAIIEQLQGGANEASNVMSAVEQGAADGRDKVERTVASLESIALAIRDISAHVDQIAAASEEQTSVASEINENVLAIRSLAEQAAEGAERTQDAGAGVRRISRELGDRVSVFRID